MKTQNDLVARLSEKELSKALIQSQFIFLLLSIVLSVFLFDHITDWRTLFIIDSKQILYYGVISGLVVVMIDMLLMQILPQTAFDDGGLNKKIFKSKTIPEIFKLALLIAVAEEMLFRGVLQTTFGLVLTSTVFALAHIRYLKKPVLLLSVILLSFYLGYLFEITGNLFVTITTHFVIDFLLGLIIRNQSGVD